MTVIVTGPSKPSRLPAVLMALGGTLLVLTALRLSSELSDDDAGTAAAPVSNELCVGRPCRANDDPFPTRGYEAATIAVNQQDPKHQVVTDVNLVGGRCGWHVTFDSGRTWEDGVFEIPADFRSCNLDTAGLLPIGNVAMGATGANVYAVLSSVRVKGSPAPHGREGEPDARGDSVMLVTSTDGGRTFGPAREIVPGGDRNNALVRPALTVATTPDGVDRLLVSMWGCESGRCQQGFFTRSDDSGATFAPPVLVTPAPGGNSPSQPVIAADGTIYMTYLRRYNDGQAELLVARSGDDGKTFDAGVVDHQNNLGLRYDSAKIAVDPKRGWVYMVFTDTRDGQSQVMFRRSRDKGRTWERVVRLHSSKGGRTYSPAMSVAPDGRIEVVFYRRMPKDVDAVHATYSTDGGKTFAEDAPLNDVPIDRTLGYWDEIGDYWAPAVATTTTESYFVWSDTRDGTKLTNTQETFLRRVDRSRAAAASS